MKKNLLYLFLIVLFTPCYSQNDEIINLRHQLSITDADSTTIDLYIQISEAFATTSNLDSSVFFYRKAFQLAKKSKDLKRIVKAQHEIFHSLIDQGKYTLAKQIQEEVLEYGYQINDNVVIAQSLVSLANWNWELSNLKQTLEHLNEALEYSEKTNDLTLKARIYNSFALLYGTLDEREKELEASLQYYEISKQQKDTLSQAIALNNLGYSHIVQNQYGEALPYLEKAIPLAKSTIKKDPVLFELLMTMKGETLIKLGQEKSGFALMESALELATQHNHIRTIIIINKNKAEYLYQSGKYDAAIKAAQIGVGKCIETGYIKELPLLCEILSESFKFKGDFQSSLLWLEEENKAKEELVKRRKNKEVVQLEIKYALQQKESENQILLLKNKNQKTFFALLVALGAILFILIFQFFRKRHQKKLEVFRQRVAADLHDEIGSNLSSITRIAKGLKSEENDPNLNQGIDQLVKKSNTTIRNVVDVIWTLDEEESKLKDLIEKMESYLDEIRISEKNTAIHFAKNNISEKTPLHINTKHHLLMVFKEAINNIQKHTNSSSIIIELDGSNQKLKLDITNHFLEKKHCTNSTGRGIVNIKRRIDELGGKVEVQENQDQYMIHVELDKVS